MLTSILIFAGVCFLAYAIYTQYSMTPADQSVAKRVWLSLVAAVGVLSAAVTAWFHSGTTP